jgi:phenylacetic acid degradation operon negative regulatory protein
MSPTAGNAAEALDTSARSVLLTVLGELVLPRNGEAWTSTLLAALETVDVKERAGRQAILRASRSGWIETERQGRRARCRLTDRCTTLLRDGAARIYDFGQATRPGDGEWLIVVTSAEQVTTDPARASRHQLRTRLGWHGLANLAPGVWLTPDTNRERAVTAELAKLGLDGCTFLGRPGQLGLGDIGVERLWDLASLADDYDAFIRCFTTLDPTDEPGAVAALIQLVHQWRRFPFSDPELPSSLLPADWPGAAAAALFAQRRGIWSQTARTWWDRIEGDAKLAARSPPPLNHHL